MYDLAPFIISTCILLAAVVGTMMLVLFIKNAQVQRDNDRLAMENRSLRRELDKAREDLARKRMLHIPHLPRRGW